MLEENGLSLMFRDARSQRAWTDKPVKEATLRQLYDLAILGPTSANCLPMRLVFATSTDAKEKTETMLRLQQYRESHGGTRNCSCRL